MDRRISEPQLILPTLYLLSIQRTKRLSTSSLITKLMKLLNPIGEDLKILSGRRDTKFSQKVRNLISHRTLDKKYEFATYSRTKDMGYLTVTEKGEIFLKEKFDILKYLLTNDFDYDDIEVGLSKVIEATEQNRELEDFDENLIIEEGEKRRTKTQTYKRSKKLRDYAITYFAINSGIPCKACNFDFEQTYGEIGKGFIEIHHIKPIIKYKEQELTVFLKFAIKNVIPLCSNCHRMIHRIRKTALDVNELKRLLKFTFSY